MPRRRHLLALSAAATLPGCFSLGDDAQPLLSHRLLDAGAGTPPPRLEAPLVPALIIQPLPSDALAESVSIAYSREAGSFAFYQFANWTERPLRRLAQLLQARIEARGVAGAVALLGEPLAADWLLTLSVDTVHHDVATPPGAGRLTLAAALFDRRQRTRVAQRSFDATVPSERADSAAAVAALSKAVAQDFDALVPWLEGALATAVAGARR